MTNSNQEEGVLVKTKDEAVEPQHEKNYQAWLDAGFVPISGGALESNIMGLWFAYQKEGKKGESNWVKNEKAAWAKRARWVGGDFQVARTDGEEAWSDQTLFSAHVDFVNTYLGNGAPVIQAQSSLITYLGWLSFGKQEVTVAAESAEFEIEGENSSEAGVFTLKVTVEGNAQEFKTPSLPKTTTGTELGKIFEEYFPGWTGNVEVKEGTHILEKIATEKIKFKFIGELANQPFTVAEVLTATGFSTTPPKFKSIHAGKLAKWVITPEETGGPWFGTCKEVGKSTIYRAQFNDCRVQSLRIEGSSASKVVKLTPTILSLNPGQIEKEAPEKKDDGLRPWLFTEAHGHLTIDGISYHGQSQFAFLFSFGLNEYYGDQVHPFDLVNNIATASIEGLTLLIDEEGIKRYYNQIYGTETPASGAKPLEILPLLGSYKAEFTRTSPFTSGESEKLIIEMFGVRWNATGMNIPANPAGGPVELSFTGMMRKEPGQGYTAGAGKKSRAEVESKPFQITVEQFKDTALYTA